MSMILDLAVIAIIVLCAVINRYQGFFRSVLSLFGFFIALIGGWFLSPYLAVYIEPRIAEYFESEASGTLSGVIMGFDFVAESVARILAFGVLFVLINVIVLVLKLVAKIVFKLPVLKQADKLLGLIFGIIVGVLASYVFSILAFTFSEVLVRSVDWVTPEMFEGSVVAKWFFEHNLLSFIMNLA